MSWCEVNGVDFLFGLAKNERLVAEIASELAAAEEESKITGQPARRFKEFQWSTRDSWSRPHRIMAKAEWTGGSANPRFVVTSLSLEDAAPQQLYEEIYCARGTWKTASRSVSSICLPTALRRRRCAPTSCACGLRRWPMCCSARCAASLYSRPIRQSDLRHDPPQAPQDRRAGAHQLPAHQIRHGLRLPLSARLRS